MDAWLNDWAQLIFRWVHVLAAIAWIGHAFFFHSMEKALRAPEVDGVDPDVHGELWMVHGGGFFRMQKTRVLPPVYTGHLHWFKYEAGLTWVSGFLLLVALYYLTGGVLMIDASVMQMSATTSVAIGLGTLIFGWVAYDFIWAGPIGRVGKDPTLGTILTVLLIASIGVGLTFVLSGRAAFLHTGALLGTIMTANVWMRIIPGSNKMVAALEKGEEPDLRLGAIGHQRSVHNGYMHFPIVFLMISNHYPFTFGSEWSAVLLLVMLALGAATRQLFYDGWSAHWAVKGVVGLGTVAVLALTFPKPPAPPPDPASTAKTDGTPIDPATAKQVRGVVRFEGEAPPPKELKLYGDCLKLATGPVYDDSVLVADGKLQNAFVWIDTGWEGFQIPAAPSAEVEVDQRGCVYAPRIHGARVGQPVTFVNSDSMFHNVRTVAKDNDTFNLNMPAKDQRITRTFLRPERMVAARCDVHPWMLSHIGLVEHDWWAISGEDGSFSFDGVPPGTYTVKAWHEVFGERTAEITVGADAPSVELVFTPAGG
ncbi:MAG: urate hydroxylase PuuD [Alphaproteobacteria bacterium]|nr:urate hydroxylase PuuD [Alphaproteobacteria bacterium]